MRIYAAVEVLGLIVQDVHLFTSEEEAEGWFKDYTGHDYKEWMKATRESNVPDEEYDQTMIFALDVDLMGEFREAVIEIAKWIPIIMKGMPVYHRTLENLIRAMNNMPRSVHMRP